LLQILGGSQFLADSLVADPDFLDWVTDPENLQGVRTRSLLKAEIPGVSSIIRDRPLWLQAIRHFRRRETLRIGVRDICLQAPVEDIVAELSALADTLVDVALDHEWHEALRTVAPGCPWSPRDRFCILALGKLGGAELNYSSDIDLIGVYDDTEMDRMGGEAEGLFNRMMEQVRSALATHTEKGMAYRVDLRLRPYGGAGKLIQPLSALLRYFRENAALWEILAFMKARPIAGNREVGRRLIEKMRPVFERKRPWREIADSILHMRELAIQTKGRAVDEDLKSGIGGIRDIEFLVQGLQLFHLPDHPELLEGNTLKALKKLKMLKIVPSTRSSELRADYLYLRRIEHYLQILHDRQTHSLPQTAAALKALSRRISGPSAKPDQLIQEIDTCRARVRKSFNDVLEDYT
jgi:glutamate-ammonia-ligase adenylyltransferase